MRVHVGPGYRVYFALRRDTVLLLCGGAKSRQTRDIERARAMLARLDRE
jgi:putative addiction module killer protein